MAPQPASLDEALTAAAERLYAAPPEDFVSRRDAIAQEVRDDRALAAAIRALRRPTRSAWLVNLLVRRQRAPVEELLRLGEALRAAEASLAGPQLRALSAQRGAAVAELVASVARLAGEAGVRPTSGTLDEVQATLQAALADPGVGAAVLSGRLVRPAQFAGFGVVDPADLVGVPLPAVRSGDGDTELRWQHGERGRATVPGGPGAGTEAAAAVDPTTARRLHMTARRDAALRRAQERLATAEAEQAAAQAAADAAEQTRADLAQELDRLREQVRDTERRLAEANLEVRSGVRRRDAAGNALARARAELARVQPSPAGR